MDLFANPRGVRLAGYVGERCTANARGLVLSKDEEALLAGFRRRPGAQAWVGEHVGKWIDAARRIGDLEEDPLLESKIARVVRELLATQEADGYLGTYAPEARWTEWDVWVHKYALLGLTAQARSRGCAAALEGAQRIVELLDRRFGANVAELFTERVSTHRGMAAGSVLGPLVHFHALARDERSLALAQKIARAMEEERGPRLVTALLEHGDVTRVANGKAYEMLSCLVGLLKLDAFAPDPARLAAAEAAARDVIAHHRYPSGGSSHHEHYTHRRGWSEAGAVAETCVVVTWIELCDALWQRTGRDEYLDEIQRAWRNALLAAQRPDGAAFCYFTPLAGTKPYESGITCCSSSGPRGIAMAPRWFCRTSGGAVEYLSFSPGAASIAREPGVLQLSATGDAALGEPCRIRLAHLAGTAREPLELRVRKPGARSTLELVTRGAELREDARSYAIRSAGSAAIEAVLRWDAPLERIDGAGQQRGRSWLWRDPWLLCADAAHGELEETAPPIEVGPWQRSALLGALHCTSRDEQGRERVLVAFAEAGRGGTRYRATWPSAPDEAAPARASATGDGLRYGRLDGTEADVLWSARGPAGTRLAFELRFDAPRFVHAAVFRHAAPRWDAGRFAERAERPRIEILTEPNGAWICAGHLPELPGSSVPELRVDPPHGFERRAELAPVTCFGLRVVGEAPPGGEVFCSGLRPDRMPG